MDITSIFKQYNQWRQRQIAINETAWQVHKDTMWFLPTSLSVAALQLRKRLHVQGIELTYEEACKRMLKLKGR